MRINLNWSCDKPKFPTRTKRLREEFLWLPKTINDELRWLEMATWTEMYLPTYFFGIDPPESRISGYEWTPIKWELSYER